VIKAVEIKESEEAVSNISVASRWLNVFPNVT